MTRVFSFHSELPELEEAVRLPSTVEISRDDWRSSEHVDFEEGIGLLCDHFQWTRTRAIAALTMIKYEGEDGMWVPSGTHGRGNVEFRTVSWIQQR